MNRNSCPSTTFETEVQQSFAQVILEDYGQILINAAALDMNPHRLRLEKIHQISNLISNSNSEINRQRQI